MLFAIKNWVNINTTQQSYPTTNLRTTTNTIRICGHHSIIIGQIKSFFRSKYAVHVYAVHTKPLVSTRHRNVLPIELLTWISFDFLKSFYTSIFQMFLPFRIVDKNSTIRVSCVKRHLVFLLRACYGMTSPWISFYTIDITQNNNMKITIAPSFHYGRSQGTSLDDLHNYYG